jgi:hypothetical protein
MDDVLHTHREVVESLPASIREDFRRLEETDPGELWRLPAVPIEQWGVGVIEYRGGDGA